MPEDLGHIDRSATADAGSRRCGQPRVCRWTPWLLLLSTSGCSFMFVDAPPSEPHLRTPHAAVECTASVALPVLDVTLGALELALGVAAAPSASQNEALSKEARTTLALSWAGIYGVSAAYGFVQTGDCRTLRREVFPESESRLPELESSGAGGALPERVPSVRLGRPPGSVIASERR